MKKQSSAWTFNKTILLSLFLHATFFFVGWKMSVPSVTPLPLGMELKYSDPPAPEKPRVSRPRAFTTSDVPAKNLRPTENPEPRAEAASENIPQGREGVAHGSEVSPEERYKYELQKLFERRQSYPLMARRMGHTGRVVVRFTVLANGTITESEVVENSPHASLNKAALDTVRSLKAVKPFPPEIQKNSWVLTIPFLFELN